MTGYWSIRTPWNLSVAADEFGAGTLDGNPADGSAFDACGPAAIENARASYQSRVPEYTNMGHMRAFMIEHDQWTHDANGNPFPVSNPRTFGCMISHVAWELVNDAGMTLIAFRDYTDALLSEAEVASALSHHAAIIFIVTNAAALAGNEANIHNHFIAVTAYGGDNPDGSVGKLYVLNSDIAGQHGTATGQWTPYAQLLAAQPHGFAVFAPPPPPVVTDPDIVAAQTALSSAQANITTAQTILAGEVHE